MTFGVSAAFTGVAGALGAVVVAFVSPDSFTVNLSITCWWAWWSAGWRRSRARSSARIFIQFVPNIADEISKSAPWAIYGLFLIVFMYLMPTGVMGGLLQAVVPPALEAAKVDPDIATRIFPELI
jgi:branched-chain amino acid transport system permease protein